MQIDRNRFYANLFYSYSHKDARYTYLNISLNKIRC